MSWSRVGMEGYEMIHPQWVCLWKDPRIELNLLTGEIAMWGEDDGLNRPDSFQLGVVSEELLQKIREDFKYKAINEDE